MNDSCRESSTWLRRATLTNISAIEARSAACSSATRTVVALTSRKACASRPTSSLPLTGMSRLVTPGPSPGVAIRSTISGSSSRIWLATSVRRRSGRVMVRESTSPISTSRATSRPPPAKTSAARVLAEDADAPATAAALPAIGPARVRRAVMRSLVALRQVDELSLTRPPVPTASMSCWMLR